VTNRGEVCHDDRCWCAEPIPEWVLAGTVVPSLPRSVSKVLEEHRVSPTRGFLPDRDPLSHSALEEFLPLEQAVSNISRLLRAERVEHLRELVEEHCAKAIELGAVRALERKDTAYSELRRALLVLSILTNAYVWCGGSERASRRLPDSLSSLIVRAADRIGCAPLLTHCSIVLYNWRRIDPAEEDLTTHNLERLNLFLDSSDESFFCELRVSPCVEKGL
jgi:hypothetical protein